VDRFHWTTRPHYLAECENCGWFRDGRNALGPAARHHDATGHTVHVLVQRKVIYEKRERYEERRAAYLRAAHPTARSESDGE